MQLVYCLARLYGANSPTLAGSLEQFAESGLSAAEHADQPQIKRLSSSSQWLQWRKEAIALADEGIRLVWRGHPDYPQRLAGRHLNHPWPVIFTLGSISHLDHPAIGLVGTRQPQPSAVRAAHIMAGKLARQGACVVSGNALGIDAAAHAGALSAGGMTAFVLPVDLPAALRQMPRESDSPRGLWLSPFLPGDAIHRGNFISRNELLAGLCDALIVGEAGLKSGAFHAVKAARRNRVPLFILCNRRGQPWGEGSKGLMKMGAQRLMPTADDADQVMSQARRHRSSSAGRNGGDESRDDKDQPELFQ